MEVEDPSVTMEELGKVKRRYKQVNSAMQAACMLKCKGRVGTLMQSAAEEKQSLHKKLLTGREMLRIAYMDYQTKVSLGQVCSLRGL